MRISVTIHLYCIVAGFWASGMPVFAQGEGPITQVAVIAHPEVGSDSLTRRELQEYYTLENNKWPDGSLVYVIEQKNESAAKDMFYQYIRYKPRELKKMWMRVVLLGEGRTPKVVRSEAEVVERVATTPGAVGYVDAALVNGDVKVLSLFTYNPES